MSTPETIDGGAPAVLKHDADASCDFLAQAFAGLSGAYINLVAIDCFTGKIHGTSVPADRPELAAAFIESHALKWNLYYGANPLRDYVDKKATRAAVLHARYLQADGDVKPPDGETRPQEWFDDQKAKLIAALRALGDYTALVDSGGGVQLLAALEEPTTDLDAVKHAANAWAHALRAACAHIEGVRFDPVGNADRVLRLPGSVNFGNSKKRNDGRTAARRAALIDWRPEHRVTLTTYGAPPKASRSAPPAVPTSCDDARLRSALDAISAKEYDPWTTVGHALKSTYGDDARALWEGWSRTNGDFDEQRDANKWDSLQPTGAVGLGTIFYLARRAGWVDTGRPSGDGRRVVELQDGEGHRALDAIRAALTELDLGVVVYADRLTFPYLKPAKGYGGRDVDMLALNRLSAAALAAKLTRAVNFVRVRKTAVSVDCPEKTVQALQDSPDLWGDLPRVDRITETPLFRDGELVATPGLCRAERAYINAPAVALPAVVDRAAAEAALARVLEWLQEFPFDTPTDKAVAVAALMTAAMRASVRHAPGFMIDKPDHGSGASTLGSLIGIVLTGREPAVITPAGGRESGEELRKQLDAMQLEGGAGIFLDNLPKAHTLRSIALAQILSQEERKVRVLGQTFTPVAPCTQMVVVTGVNVSVGQDLVRRFVRCRLDPQCAAPRKRAFRRPNLIAEAQAARVALLADLYTIAAAYVRSGERVQGARINGFEQWQLYCRDPLLWLGMADPVLSTDELEADDEDEVKHAELLSLWFDACGGDAVTVAAVMKTDFEDHGTPASELRASLRAASGCRSDDDALKVNRGVALVLKRVKGKVGADGLRLVSDKVNDGRKVAEWRIERVDGKRLPTAEQRRADLEAERVRRATAAGEATF